MLNEQTTNAAKRDRPPSTIHLITTTLPIPAVAKAAPPKKQKKNNQRSMGIIFLAVKKIQGISKIRKIEKEQQG